MQQRISLAILLVITLVPIVVSAMPKAIIEGFHRMLPNEQIISVTQMMPGIYQVISKGEVVYLSEDGNFLLAGSVWDTMKKQNLTEVARQQQRLAALEEIDENQMLVYAPKDYKYAVNVFTDVDCVYCRKFHAHMSELYKLGIRVNYFLTPYRGEESYARAVGVWCAKDRHAAMNRAKRGKKIPLKECTNPIDKHLRLAQRVGVQGTPAMILENGTFISGYRPPQELLEILKREIRI